MNKVNLNILDTDTQTKNSTSTLLSVEKPKATAWFNVNTRLPTRVIIFLRISTALNQSSNHLLDQSKCTWVVNIYCIWKELLIATSSLSVLLAYLIDLNPSSLMSFPKFDFTFLLKHFPYHFHFLKPPFNHFHFSFPP